MEPTGEQSEILKNVPLIPLRDLVVFPATLVPFIIGRPSSIQALEKAAGCRFGSRDQLKRALAQVPGLVILGR